MATMAEVFRVFLICYSKMQGQNFHTHTTNASFILLPKLLYTIILSPPKVVSTPVSHQAGPRCKFQREDQLSQLSYLTVFLRQLLI
jgi:hypothetical protein